MKIQNFALIILSFLFVANSSINQAMAQSEDILIEQHPKINNIPVNSLIIDFNNNKWVGTEKGLFKINDYDEYTELIKAEGILDAIMGENEKGWFCTYGNKLGMFDKDVTYSTNVPQDQMVTCMDIIGSDIWLGTTNGLYKISLKTKEENHIYTTENSKLLSNRINDIFVDGNGQIWLGTEEGLSTIKEGKWISHLRKVNVSAIEAFNGSIVAAGDGGLWRFKSDTWEELSLPEEFLMSPIEDLCYDKKGSLWIAGGILGRLDANWMPSIYGEKDGFGSAQPICLAVDQRNNVWVGTAGKGLFVIKQKKEPLTEQPFAFADKDMNDELIVNTEKSIEASPSILFSIPQAANNAEEKFIAPNPNTGKTMINGRMVKPGRVVNVEDKRIKIAVWNAQGSSDGDVISLYYNGKLLLKEYQLTQKRKVLTLKVGEDSTNELVMFAHTGNNAGVKTVKVAMLHDDHPSKWITLIGDNEYSDQVAFRLKK